MEMIAGFDPVHKGRSPVLCAGNGTNVRLAKQEPYKCPRLVRVIKSSVKFHTPDVLLPLETTTRKMLPGIAGQVF